MAAAGGSAAGWRAGRLAGAGGGGPGGQGGARAGACQGIGSASRLRTSTRYAPEISRTLGTALPLHTSPHLSAPLHTSPHLSAPLSTPLPPRSIFGNAGSAYSLHARRLAGAGAPAGGKRARKAAQDEKARELARQVGGRGAGGGGRGRAGGGRWAGRGGRGRAGGAGREQGGVWCRAGAGREQGQRQASLRCSGSGCARGVGRRQVPCPRTYLSAPVSSCPVCPPPPPPPPLPQWMLSEIRRQYPGPELQLEDVSGGQEAVPIPVINQVGRCVGCRYQPILNQPGGGKGWVGWVGGVGWVGQR